MPNKTGQFREGKTKRIHDVEGNEGEVIVENKSDITANDDKALTRILPKKAEYATTTTCRVFEFLRSCGLPVAYLEQVSETEFLALKSVMVWLEIIGRRIAIGSYLKRYPELTPLDSTKPHRFHRLVFELFLKTNGQRHGDMVLPCDDPWIIDPYASVWQLGYPKKTIWTDDGRRPHFGEVDPATVLPEGMTVEQIELLLRRVCLVLERGLALLGLKWCDIKIEVDAMGNVSDVVDNDSWRVLKGKEHMDKQVFRDKGDAALEEIERKYGEMARLVSRLVLPRQALVLWRGSANDADFKNVPTIPGVEIVNHVGSAHKSPVRSLQEIEGIFGEYPQGGVILVKVGRSNGAGPVFAAHSPWPVVSIPDTLESCPEDVFSSVRLPTATPALTTWPESNGIDAAIQMLGITNAAAYAHSQLAREALDDYVSI